MASCAAPSAGGRTECETPSRRHVRWIDVIDTTHGDMVVRLNDVADSADKMGSG